MKSSLFYKYFPVPKIMNMNGAGIDITDTAVRFVKMHPEGCEFALKEYGEYPLPPATFYRGKIENREALRETLLRVQKEHHLYFVYASLPETQAYLVEMDIPTVKKKDLRESIELQIEEHVPLSITEAVFDYTVVEGEKGQGGATKVLVSVAPKELVSDYTDVFAEVGLKLLSLETDAQSLSRALIPFGNTGTFMIIHFGAGNTGIYIVNHESVQFASDVELDMLAITEEMKKSNETADPKKLFADLKEEVEKHFSYWSSHKDKSSVEREDISHIILCGEEVSESMIGFLAASFHVSVEVANVWTNVLSFDRDIPQMSFQESIKYATAIGLAINGRGV